MGTPAVMVRGTVKPDGTLELDEQLKLPAGRVQVVVQPLPAPAAPAENWWDFLQKARARLEAAGHRFRTQEEIDAEIEDLRSDREDLEAYYRAPGKGQAGDKP